MSKEPIRVSVFNRKGGCGKTTTCINLAAAYAEAHKKSKVLIIDCDSQSHVRAGLIDNVPEEERTGYTVVDVLNGICSFDDALMQAHIEKRRSLIPIPVYFVQTPITDGAFLNADGEPFGDVLDEKDAFCRMLAEKEEEFDLILFDLPPVLSNGLGLPGIYYSDFTLIPTILAKNDLDGLQTAFSELENVKDLLDTEVENLGVIANMYSSRATVQKDLGDELAEAIGKEFFEARINYTTTFQQASAMGEPVVYFAPMSPAAINYRTFEKEFEKRVKKARK